MKRIVSLGIKRLVFMILMFLLASVVFTGCSKVEKKEIEEPANMLSNADFYYDSANDITLIKWQSDFTNNTIYNIKGFEITFALYDDGVLTGTKEFHYDTKINAGRSDSSYYNFYVSGKVNSLEFVSLKLNYIGVWKTYLVWWLIAIITPVILVVLTFIFDFDWGTDWKDLMESPWFIAIFSTIVIPLVVMSAVGTISWFTLIICTIGVVEYFVLYLLGKLIFD